MSCAHPPIVARLNRTTNLNCKRLPAHIQTNYFHGMEEVRGSNPRGLRPTARSKQSHPDVFRVSPNPVKEHDLGNVAHLLGAKYPSTRPVTRTTKPEPRCRTRPRYTNQSASTARDARTEPPPNGSCPNRAARTTEPGRVPAKSRFPAWWQSRGKQTK